MSALDNFTKAHDYQSSLRQRGICDLALMTTAFLWALYHFGVDADHHRWRPTWPHGILDTFTALLVISIVLLAFGSDVPLILRLIKSSISEGTAQVVDIEVLRKNRMFFHYGGFLSQLAVMVILIERTGGLRGSPFTAALLAILLAAQQLGRYRLNSRFVLIIAAAIFAIMLGVEYEWSPPDLGTPPRWMILAILLAVFVTAGAITHWNKPSNQRLQAVKPTLIIVGRGTEVPGKGRPFYYSAYEGSRRVESWVGAPAECLDLVTAKSVLEGRYQRDGYLISWTEQGDSEAYGVFEGNANPVGNS